MDCFQCVLVGVVDVCEVGCCGVVGVVVGVVVELCYVLFGGVDQFGVVVEMEGYVVVVGIEVDVD